MHIAGVLTTLLILVGVHNAQCYLNVYMNVQEGQKLLGLPAELFYIRAGVVNTNALDYVINIPSRVSSILINWQSLIGRPISYGISVSNSLPSAISVNLNITKSGYIPTELDAFQLALVCREGISVEADVNITIQVTLNRALNNVTEFTLRRRKMCYAIVESEDELFLDSVVPPERTENGILAICVGCVVSLVIATTLMCVALCFRNSLSYQKSKFSKIEVLQELPKTQKVVPVVRNPPPPASEPQELHRRISELTVQRCRVRLSSLLQEGTYGKVYRGSYNDTDEVLVKTVGQHASQIQVSLLLQEGMSLYGASHAGILSVLGVSIEDHTAPFLLYPAPDNTRNLKLFLQTPLARTLTTIQIVRMSSQIALALAHLHSHGVIHKDVATRNCVINDELRIKLADNSLSRDLFPGDYHCLGDGENRPIKWFALEALQDKIFSEASDTWAFGVFMWELCTLAKQPYAEVDCFEMEHYLRDGYRLSQPVNCPDELFAIMAYCWALLPQERPTFDQLDICLQDFYSQITKYV
ncbi:tyrosine-protein kinase Dnt [Phlebotomus argentipes]|uniref:tyrosine-protein kinase Dnt n=1 Tax=Phlebotomus argentipes TaxID=94469 RepID=UPI002892A9CC|nr:tyrosine-protein kinase Dnt [Phlebotomus argentipes]